MNGNTTMIIAVGVVIVMVAAGVGAFMVLNRDKDSSTEIDAALEVYGNANGDYKIDESDVEIIKKVKNGEEGYTLEKYPLADAYKDDVIDDKDIEQVNKIIAGGNSDGTQMTVWVINHTTDTTNYANGQYSTEVKWPVKKCIANGAANALIIYEIVGIKDNIAGINYNKSSPPDKIVYADYLAKPNLSPTSNSTNYLDETPVKDCVQENPEVSCVLTADNKNYLNGDKGMSEEYIKTTLKLDVVRIEHAAVDPDEYASAILTVGFLFQKSTRAEEAAEWITDVFKTIEDKTSGLSEKTRVAATSYYNYLSARNSDYADVVVQAGGQYSLWAGTKSTIYFENTSSATADPNVLLPQNQPDVIIALRTSGFLGSGASWYGSEDDWKPATMNSHLEHFMVFECYKNKKVYTISGDMPIVARVLYSAAIMYPDLITMDFANEKHQEFVDKFLGGAYNVSEHRFVLSQSDVEALKPAA